MNITRRSFLPLLAAPFVVRAASLMPVSSAKLIVPGIEPADFWKMTDNFTRAIAQLPLVTPPPFVLTAEMIVKEALAFFDNDLVAMAQYRPDYRSPFVDWGLTQLPNHPERRIPNP